MGRLDNKHVCLNCNKDFLGTWNQMYCTPICRELHASSGAAKYYQHKKGAESRGLSHSISLDSFFELKNSGCYYCGFSGGVVGIDRRDSLLGYDEGNVVGCCSSCNYMKHMSGQESFLLVCNLIAKKHPVNLGDYNLEQFNLNEGGDRKVDYGAFNDTKYDDL